MYLYETEKQAIFTDEGQVKFLNIRDRIKGLLQKTGCITMEHAISSNSGTSFFWMACVDRMVEIGELVEVVQQTQPAGQDRIFREPYN